MRAITALAVASRREEQVSALPDTDSASGPFGRNWTCRREVGIKRGVRQARGSFILFILFILFGLKRWETPTCLLRWSVGLPSA